MPLFKKSLHISFDRTLLREAESLGIDVKSAAERGLRAAILAKTHCQPARRARTTRERYRAYLEGFRTRARLIN